MTDQMTPAELRAAGERHYHCQSSERDVDVLIDAARRLADVIEYAEFDSHMLGMSDGYAEALRDTLRLARGETNERDKP